MQVKVLLWRSSVGALGRGEICKRRIGGHHKERHCLRARGREGLLFAILKEVRADVGDGVEEAWIVV